MKGKYVRCKTGTKLYGPYMVNTFRLYVDQHLRFLLGTKALDNSLGIGKGKLLHCFSPQPLRNLWRLGRVCKRTLPRSSGRVSRIYFA